MIDMSLDRYAVECFRELIKASGTQIHEVKDEKARISEDVAYAVGAYAARKGMSREELKKWAQRAYGSIWVREMNLSQGIDMKDLLKFLYKAYDFRAKKMSLASISKELDDISTCMNKSASDRLIEVWKADKILEGLIGLGSINPFEVKNIENLEDLVEYLLTRGYTSESKELNNLLYELKRIQKKSRGLYLTLANIPTE